MQNTIPTKPRPIYSNIGFAFFLLTISGCMFSEKTSKQLFKKAEAQSYDMIIVPGVPLEDTANWSRTMMGRVYWAKYLFDMGIAKNIMFSGAAVYTPYYEGMIMALYAEALGVPGKNIFAELKAEHSTENVYYSYKMAKQLGFKTMAIASDPFQSKQLRRFARLRLSPDVGIIPFVVDTLKILEPHFIHPKIDFHKAYKEDFIPLSQREGWWKRLRGTMGWNRDRNAYE